MIFKIDLLDALSIQLDCTYLSDLHHLNDWQRARLVRALEQTPSDAAEQVTAGSHRKIWWQCPEGHVWKAVIYSRAGPQKTGCPVCAGTVRRRRAPVPLTSDQIAGHRV